jgi:hypothetical protein
MEYEILYWLSFTGYILFFSNAVSMMLAHKNNSTGHLDGRMTFITGTLTVLFMTLSVITFMNNLDLIEQSKKHKIIPQEVTYKIQAIDVSGDTIWEKVKDTTVEKPIEVNFDNYLKNK